MEHDITSASLLAGPIEEGEAFRILQSADAAPAPRARARVRSRRLFHVGMALAFIATAFLGFAPSFYMRAPSQVPLSPLVHIHGMVFTSWLLLLLAQSTLVSARRVKMHRRLGIAGTILAAAMVPFGLVTAIDAARRGLTTPGLDAVELMIFPMGSIILFAGFMTAAIWKRRAPELHRRLVLLSTVAIIPPAIARMEFVGMRPVVALFLSLLFIVAGMLHDRRTRGRVHRIYIVGACIILMSGPARYAIGHTDAWRSFAAHLIAATAPAEKDAVSASSPDGPRVDWNTVRAMPIEAVALRTVSLPL